MTRLYVDMPNPHTNQHGLASDEIPNPQTCEHVMHQYGPKTVERFRKQKPPTFDGLADPSEAEHWIRSLERIFEFLECTDAEKVTCAVHQFVQEADYWWETMVHMMTPEEKGELTWEDFKIKFFEKYIPQTYQQQKETEFWNLQQGTRSVTEYDRIFTRLSRYAPQQVDTEAKRVEKFRRGLRPEIGIPLAGQGDLTFAQALGRALRIEAMMPTKAVVTNITAAPILKSRREGPPPPKSRRSKPLAQGRPSHSQRKPNQIPTCPICQRSHFGLCQAGSFDCFQCGQPGHVRRYCPRNVNRSHNQSATPKHQGKNTKTGSRVRRPPGLRPPQNSQTYALIEKGVVQTPDGLAGMMPIHGNH